MLPVITISRQFGSGGHEVGEKLARQLDVPFYDKALIAMAAKQSGLSEEVFANADEKATSSLLYSMVMGSYSFGARVPGINEMPINDKLFIIQSDIIKKAAADGPCVIIGRCADYILREHENCLNVFVHASKEERVRRSIAKKDCEERKASDFVTKKDKQRANYYNFYSNKRWDDLQNYDITLDTSRFTVDEAVDILMDAAKRLDR
ncbi:cytidylate kinase-like family protein [Acutalibacter muris]|jgi:cytidylate kinase|uniref:Cytidylate kinase-like family protein n=1 Tax=Acutalibacter muris TaxID=1796620 RepID=A0A1Z2XLL2_9FIRM|nr:cytidylate kinase-like family protein [Acutalibacter muris]ANU54005.1 cytidylate kinase [Hungateiclostridiaceae bacterium KB18]ASB39314.1 cytidylate kinase-like family protein [Acutalibacter muris]MCI9543212.1 cytidylate kinase-like family protein [Acutalibacter muris]QQR28604.1 cytidylate kinase-like family protein [Acutalibacter muris]